MATMPKAEALFSRDIAVYVTVFMEFVVFGVLFIFVYFLIKKLVVDNMEKVNRSEGETYAQDLITAHPNLGAIFCHSEDPAMGAASALEAAGRTDVLIAAFDCSPEIVEGIRNGSIAGTSAQQPVLMGRNAAQAIVDHRAGKEGEEEMKMDTMLVTKDNI